ncbi:HPr(Ser) kinase/phosphatase [Brackiella oedipodis]|uniref:HPr(Ser) kinase/phosphatase n=1 Tax=Brackiella oedipodis TaxID=124225 RepID=UPI00048FAE7D|nr:HPr(Ser) kinase/phosphatase [Brackiella oedipodis]
MLSIADIIAANQNTARLVWIAGQNGVNRKFIGANTSGSDLVGHLNMIHPSRIQIFGKEEIVFYNKKSANLRERILLELCNGGAPCLIVADELEVPADLIDFCNRYDLPLLSSNSNAAHVIDVLREYLGRHYAPQTTVHGVFMDVLGVGVLITGKSGLGKSELALELISRGHGLVADDAVQFSRVAPTLIVGHCPPLLRNLLEVRGIGLLDICTIFGETSVRRKMSLKLIVNLVQADHNEYERLPMQAQTQEVLGLPIRYVMIPVAAGRNLAVLVEAAVRNTILQLRGIDTLGEFMQRQSAAMKQNQLDQGQQ